MSGISVSQVLILVLIFVGGWFLLIRPQQQRQKQHAETVQALKNGARVVTIGGLVGEIVDVRQEVVVIRTAGGSELEYVRDAISRVLRDDELTLEEPEHIETDEEEPPVALPHEADDEGTDVADEAAEEHDSEE